MTLSVAALLAAALRLWTPLAFAALGGVVSERAGVINIALESMMLGGAFASIAAARATGSVLVGVLAGIAVGAAIGLLHAVLTLALRVPHILSGVGLNLGALGLTTFTLRLYGGQGLEAPRTIPAEAMILTAALLTGAVWFVLARTPLGLRLRACGENPAAARSAGVSVAKIRYGAVIASGALAGLGGVALALSSLGVFTENMTSGRGYIALAAVIFGRWSALGATGAAFLFGFGDAVQFALQTNAEKVALTIERLPSPLSDILLVLLRPDLITLLPYVLTLIALTLFSGRNRAPAALGRDAD